MENEYIFDMSEYQKLVDNIKSEILTLSDSSRQSLLRTVFSCIDNTTLNGSDTPEFVAEFCRSTVSMSPTLCGARTTVASVCVYPSFVALAKTQLKGTGIGVASVAGGFPAGQTSQHIKTDEVCYVVDEGADEVDFVINRGRFLSGDEQYVFDEVAAAKEACGNDVRLKVIVECGDLKSPSNIYRASLLALRAGADFVKTSTGKIPVGATPEAAYAMLCALRDFAKNSNKMKGFKAAGGISTIEDAILYLLMKKKILNVDVVNNQNFRIGTSRLTSQLSKILTF